jgi:hypothetical protein
MTKAHVEKFGEVLLSDPDMSEKLGLSKFLATLESNDSEAQATSKATFVDNAVEEATSRGLIFSKEEFKENLDVEVMAMQSGELSDLQLEAVAGGKLGVEESRERERKRLGYDKGI